MKDELKTIKEMQKVVEQMRLDDLEEDPSLEFEMFDCDCCGECKSLAGSIQYNDYRLCNDCVLYAEAGFELGKINKIEDLIDKYEDKRLQVMCDFIKQDEKISRN